MEQLMKRAASGDAASQYELGLSLLCGCCCHKDWPTGVRWLQRAADAGEPRAVSLMADLARVTEGHLTECCSESPSSPVQSS